MHIDHADANGWACALVCELGNRAHMRRFWSAFGRLSPQSQRQHCWQDEGIRCWGFLVAGHLVGVRESYGELIIEGPASILEPLATEVGSDPWGSHLPRHTVVELPDDPSRPKPGDPGVPF